MTGATGNVGRHVVDMLLDADVDVRALTRRPSVARLPAMAEVCQGDLYRPSSLADALRGVDRMFLFPVDETAKEVVELARKAGVRRIVVLSAAAVTIGLHTNPVEQVVEASGLEWTHVRPGEFMTNKLELWGPGVRAERVVRYPYPDEAGAPIHEADIAAVAVAALLEDRHTGRIYTITGPERLTAREQVQAIGAAIGEEVRFEVVSPRRARALAHAQGGFAAMHADLLFGFSDYDGSQGSGEDGFSDQDFSALTWPWPDLQEATGKPGRTFAQWASDHVDDFR